MPRRNRPRDPRENRYRKETCSKCQGNGYRLNEHNQRETCSRCQGDGYIWVPK